MSVPPFTPADRFSALIRYITQSVSIRTGWDRNLSLTMIGLITERLRNIKWAFLRIAARVQAGRYVRRAAAPRRRGGGGWRPGPLPRNRGWLEPLIPQTIEWRGHLAHLLQDPEMLALIEAAPEALGRPLRSLHWMLGLRPPAILKIRKAPPAAPPPTPVAPPARPPAKPPTAPAPAPFRAASAPVVSPAPTPAPGRRKPA